MNYTELKNQLPRGVSDFADFRQNGFIYIDKTRFVYELAVQKKAKLFLTRPRRFGKTLLISTFASLFEHGLRDFKGLAIEKLWREERTYRVVRLNFSAMKGFADIDGFRQKFNSHLATKFRKIGFEYRPLSVSLLTDQLTEWLQGQPLGSVVLLIDEYDAPLTSCLTDPKLFDAVRKEMLPFFSAVKDCDSVWRFVFMTGITKISQTGIFSETNQFTDVSLQKEYAALLGYTAEEIRTCFADHVAYAAEALHTGKENILNGLEENYDGYCFDGMDDSLTRPGRVPERVYSPWSVLQFFYNADAGFKNYWIASGGQLTVLEQYLQGHKILAPEQYGVEQSVSYQTLSASCDLDRLDDIALLTQTGYLTIKKRIGNNFLVGYPNREVALSMAELYTTKLVDWEKRKALGGDENRLTAALESGDVEALVREINLAFLAIHYAQFPVKCEADCRAAAQLLIRGAGFYAQSEVANALGRSDLEVDVGRFRWVFEFKFLGKEECDNRAGVLLSEARQQVREKKYGVQSGQALVGVALVYSEKRRGFVLSERLAL